MPDVSMGQLAQYITLTVRVKGQRIFWARWWVARKLLTLAALVAGCGLEVEEPK
jgi:hypothetical protein